LLFGVLLVLLLLLLLLLLLRDMLLGALAGCTGALPATPPGALPWSSSCVGQASCSTQCDTAAGYSPGTVSMTCNTNTNTWILPPTGTCSKQTGA
jgi:hypothetical protein